MIIATLDTVHVCLVPYLGRQFCSIHGVLR